jgi:hypothetical protein
MPTLRTMLLVWALFGAAGATRAQDKPRRLRPKLHPPSLPNASRFPMNRTLACRQRYALLGQEGDDM